MVGLKNLFVTNVLFFSCFVLILGIISSQACCLSLRVITDASQQNGRKIEIQSPLIDAGVIFSSTSYSTFFLISLMVTGKAVLALYVRPPLFCLISTICVTNLVK